MQIRAFHIRLSKEHQHEDEAALNDFLHTVTVKKTATQFVAANLNFWSVLVFYEALKIPEIPSPTQRLPDAVQVQNAVAQNASLTPKPIPEKPPLTDEEIRIFDVLHHWRRTKADELSLPAYMVCHNSELEEIVSQRPQTLEDFGKIKGFGPVKTAKFGEEILTVLNVL